MGDRIKKEVRIVGGTAKIVETKNGKIIRVVEDYKEYIKRKREPISIIKNDRDIKNDDIGKYTKKEKVYDCFSKNIISIDNIINIAKSSVVYREPWKYQGRRFMIKLGDEKFGCTVDHKILRHIDKIMEDDIEKRKFPTIQDYIKECIIKWSYIYRLTNRYEDPYLPFISFRSSSHNIDKALSAADRRFHLDYIYMKNILVSNEKDNNEKDNILTMFRDDFLRHLGMVLSSPMSATDIWKIKNYINTDSKIRYIIGNLENKKLVQNGYLDSIKYKKNDDISILFEYKGLENDLYKVLMDILTYPRIVYDDNEEYLMKNYLYDIIKKDGKKFEIISDYIYMCIKEWTNIYSMYYKNHPSNYRYILEIEVKKEIEKHLCDNYTNAVRKDRTLIPSFGDFHCETNLDKWFKKNYNIFGFTDIVRHNIDGIDYICKCDDRHLSIGLEYESGNFILHGHNPDTVDIVICYKKDKDLSMPIIPILELSKEI